MDSVTDDLSDKGGRAADDEPKPSVKRGSLLAAMASSAMGFPTESPASTASAGAPATTVESAAVDVGAMIGVFDAAGSGLPITLRCKTLYT
jgi:hypothetical protein